MRTHQTNVEALASEYSQELNERLDSIAQGVRTSDVTVSLCSVDQAINLDSIDTLEEASILWGDVFIESRL